jgi:PAS domain S-box-containing protein
MPKAKDYILYVDDDLNNLEIFKVLLEDDFEIVTESSTNNAYNELKKYPFKVLIADQRMPEETGLSFIERITPEYPDLIKIIFTAHYDHEAAIKAVNQGGIYRYIMKPWNTQEIKITLDNAIREFDLRVENKNLLNELTQKNQALIKAYNQVKESETNFQNIFTYSSDGIGIFKDKTLLQGNPAFNDIFEFTQKGSNIDTLNLHIRQNFPTLLTKTISHTNASEGHIVEMEIALDGKKKYLELNNKSIDFKNDVVTVSIIRDITDRKQIEQRIIEAIIKTQEEDQKKYAAELHDGLGPILSTLKMYIEWISQPSNTVNKEKITQQTIQGINDAISIVKEIANNLSPHLLQRFGLVNAIQAHIDSIKTTSGVDFVISSNLNYRIESRIETALYRILLECINNTIKHAQAKKVIIKFKVAENKLTISFADNGKGFDVNKALREAKGMGLFNIQNRIKLIGGDIQLKSNIGIGTDIEIKIVINNE